MVVLGRVAAPFGVRGWIKLSPMGDDPSAWREMPAVWLCRDAEAAAEQWQRFELQELRPHGKGLVAKLVGVDDRNGAEALDGSWIGAPREELPATAEDEWYWTDLIGLQVVNEQGAVLGTVAEMLETGANAVMVLREGAGPKMKERLLPFIAQVVTDVNVGSGVIRVDWAADW
jgi:16S rRNA processing protein RimM